MVNLIHDSRPLTALTREEPYLTRSREAAKENDI